MLSPQELSNHAVYLQHALQKPVELTALLEMLYELKPKVVLEIGAGKGGTSFAWSKLPSVERLITVDMPEGPWGGTPKEVMQKQFEHFSNNSKAKISYITGNSQSSECLEAVKKELQNGQVHNDTPVDFLFIDGDHSYQGVKTDFLTYSPLVRSGGFIAFHDIAYHPPESGCEVERFWKEILASGIPDDQWTELIQPTDPAWGGIGVIRW